MSFGDPKGHTAYIEHSANLPLTTPLDPEPSQK